MPAYVIVDTKIEDPVVYEDYKAQARPIAESFGGIYRARGGDMDVVESDLWTPHRLVIVEFPSMEKAQAFLNCPEYAPVAKIRHGAAKCSLTIIDGV
ncbi:hypothetical protein PsW64_00163 [Pseudovibrio sp. W64]|uniref:DUF1330 domain-containing protein n=1 Tax=unclassified Pseudovibrio TaxID=2627060 RepID=UPI0007AEA309|nr:MULTISPECIES: DUF1330 domain-containing protein [unclassified Pseudovibrio]KZK91833.1 hypothetical protein PsW64_00163 [Pseudovibrio sp. W64]KZL03408.1 hypothetical protein PsW74_00483 [Pseudovibrio sp. W74]KZL10110.1 hypothetical protein PsAD14_01635 [Pseudovibrio sp. Ad14]KZL14139.1 hypothetical protein PsAD26_01606 [Pseudovibrio sp. Ad26]